MAKRIALVVPSAATSGGVGAVAEFLVRTVRDRTDYDLTVVSLAMSARDPASLCLTRPATWPRGVAAIPGDFRGEPCIHVGARFGEIETWRYRPRAALVRALAGADLIQVVCGTPAWANPVLGLGIPVSVQVATLIEVERTARIAAGRGPAGAWRRLMTRRNARLETPVLRAVDAVQVENRWMLDHVRAVTAGAGTEVRLACPGVDEALFRPRERPRALPGTILSVGRMRDPRKNHMLLLDAYARLCARMDPAPRLALAGPDGPSEAFLARARALGLSERIDIHVFPSKEALATLYREATAFLLASDEEGFGVTVIEAMSSGTPPVSTRSGGPDDIITHGRDGYLADTGDAEGLAKGLHRVLSDPAHHAALSRAARATVERGYGQAGAGRAFVEVFERFLGPARTGSPSGRGH